MSNNCGMIESNEKPIKKIWLNLGVSNKEEVIPMII